MTTRVFRVQRQPNRPYAVSGQLLNRQAAEANTLALERPTTQSVAAINTAIRGDFPHQSIGQSIVLFVVTGYGSVSNEYTGVVRSWAGAGGWQTGAKAERLDASGYWEVSDTRVSKWPTSGIGYGQIPAYGIGDVVPAYLDEVRGQYVPIHSPFEDRPMAEYFSRGSQPVPMTLTYMRNSEDNLVEAYIDVRRPLDSDWYVASHLSWRMAVDNKRWWDTRSNFVSFDAPYGTYIRLRVVKGGEVTRDIDVSGAVLHFFGAGRRSFNSVSNRLEWLHLEGGTIKVDWELNAAIAGRFQDSPSFVPVGTGGVFQAQYADQLDSWIVGLNWSVTLRAHPSPISITDGTLYLAKTDSGGLPHMRGLGPHPKPGQGTITLQRILANGEIHDCIDSNGNPRQETAYNTSWISVAPNTFIHVKREYCSKKLLVDFDPCGEPTL